MDYVNPRFEILNSSLSFLDLKLVQCIVSLICSPRNPGLLGKHPKIVYLRFLSLPNTFQSVSCSLSVRLKSFRILAEPAF